MTGARYVTEKLPRKWRKCNLVLGHGLCGSQLERAMNWIDRPRTRTDERMLSGRRVVLIAWWAGAGFGRFFIDLSFLCEQSFSGLDFLRARLLWLCAPLISIQSFYNYARGHREVARSFFRTMHSVHLISVEQYNWACLQSANCSGVCWEEGMGVWGVLVFQEVGTMKSLHWRCEMWFDCVER